jgi:hypothetical protein
MIYLLDLIWKQPIEVEADSREQAVELAQKMYPNHQPDFIVPYGDESGSGIDLCYDCGKPIFDDDKHHTNLCEGITLCAACMPSVDDLEAACDQCDHPTGVSELETCIKCKSKFCKDCVNENNHECITEMNDEG